MIRNILRKRTLSKRILLIYIICVFLPIIMTTTYLGIKLENAMRTEEKTNLRISLERTCESFESNFISCMQVTNYVALDDTIQDFVNKEYTSDLEFYQEYNQEKALLLTRYAALSDTVKEIIVYSDNQTLSNSSGYRKLNEVKNQEWYEKFSKLDKPQMIFSGIQLEGSFNPVRAPFISMVSKGINQKKKYENEFIVRVNFNILTLYKILEMEKNYYQFYLINDENQIVLSTNRQYEPVDMKCFQNYEDIKIQKNQLVNEVYFGKSNLLKGWKLVGIANREQANERIRTTRIGIVFILLFCTIGSGILTAFLSYSYTKRIRLLRDSIEQVKDQKYEQIDIKPQNDDMGKLVTTYNHMSDRIDKLVNEVYKLELQKKDWEIEQIRAELNFLQSQLNPHFLFNTLNALLVVSIKKNYSEITPILKNFSKLMRRLLNWSDELVSVQEEIEFVKMYLEIEKFRFMEKMNYSIEIEEEALHYKIPKMTIQPLVENACKHGIQRTIHGGTICIKIFELDSNLYICIEDDGIGISEERIEEIKQSFTKSATDELCVGVRNVYKRLKLYYQDDFSFEIKSMKGQCTEVTICIKCKLLTTSPTFMS